MSKLGPYEVNTIVVGDCLDVMRQMPDGCVDLVVTSPPYFNAKPEYAEYEDYEAYLSWLATIWPSCHRVLKTGGRIAVNIGAGYNRAPWLPLSVDVTKQLQRHFLLRGQVVWDKAQQNAGQTAWGSWMSASNPHFRERHEIIIVGSKNEFGKGYKGQSDIERDEFLFWTQSVWRFSAQTGSLHPAPFPAELPHRLIKLFTYVGDLIFDPFMGSGTTAMAAARLGRSFFGCDINPDYVEMGLRRVEKDRLMRSQLEMEFV